MPKKDHIKFYIIGFLCLSICGVLSLYYFPPKERPPQRRNEHPYKHNRPTSGDSSTGGSTNNNTAHKGSADDNSGFLGSFTSYFTQEKASFQNLLAVGLVVMFAIVAFKVLSQIIANRKTNPKKLNKATDDSNKKGAADSKHTALANVNQESSSDSEQEENDNQEKDIQQIDLPPYLKKLEKQLLGDGDFVNENDADNGKIKNPKPFSTIKTGALAAYLNGEGQHNRFALLAFEGALVVAGKVNLGLIKALQSKGVTDIALVFDMRAEEISNEKAKQPKPITCSEVIKILENKGLMVWAVLTNADSVYKQGLGAVYKDLIKGRLHEKVKQKEKHKKQQQASTAKPSPSLLSKEIVPQIGTTEEDAYKFLLEKRKHNKQNKKSMFTYFMERCGQFEGTLFFIHKDDIPIVPLEGNTATQKLKLAQPKKQQTESQKNAEKILKYTWGLYVAKGAKKRVIIPDSRSILYAAVHEYHSQRNGSQFILVCIQVPKNSNQAILARAIGPQTTAYYKEVLFAYGVLASKEQPLIYVRPGNTAIQYYLQKSEAAYHWGVLGYSDKVSKKNLFVTLIARSSN